MPNSVLDPGDTEVNKMRFLALRSSQSSGQDRCVSQIHGVDMSTDILLCL